MRILKIFNCLAVGIALCMTVPASGSDPARKKVVKPVIKPLIKPGTKPAIKPGLKPGMKPGTRPELKAATKPSGPPPVIHCDKPEHDFGTVAQGEAATHVFTVRNKGKGVLNIERARGG
jgi:hypothetical protein